MTIPVKTVPKPYYGGTKTLDGNPYRFKFYWNTTTQIWYMSMTGITNGITIRGVALLVGKELLAKHGYSNVLGELRVIDSADLDEDPTYAGMGDRWTLEYTPLEDL